MNDRLLQKGQVVCSIAGRDKGTMLAVIDSNNKRALLADGKYRQIERPKEKLLKHVLATDTILLTEQMATNKKLKCAIAQLKIKGEII